MTVAPTSASVLFTAGFYSVNRHGGRRYQSLFSCSVKGCSTMTILAKEFVRKYDIALVLPTANPPRLAGVVIFNSLDCQPRRVDSREGSDSSIF